MNTRLRVFDRISDAVGWTPLVRLGRSVDGRGCEAFAKLEFLNPMGSVKDRIARHMVAKALADGRLHAGDLVVESSSGNTAMGLAMMSILEGLRCTMVVRRQTSREKLDCLRAMGIDLVLVDGDLPPEDPESYNQKAKRIAAASPGAFFPDQHNNRENSEAHYLTTGPEIWRQMEGRIDYLVAGIGTGGTICGTSRYLKEQDPSITVIAVDPEGSVFYDQFHTGSHGRPGRYLIEGLGDEEIIGCPDFSLIDDMYRVSDREAFLAARELARTEAILAGGSSGAALWGVRKLIAGLDAPARIVTIFPDSGSRYMSTIYSDDWMRAKGFL
ncbi:MAG TPA: cysteine synthase family protein [Thermoanaerobaculales bacterium]|nr:cysteine synthase family protein [Thermoanaerobaculales bacterium]HQP42288.1 cysteine synthase family protein [Thermoanaerobaculales bacterium]